MYFRTVLVAAILALVAEAAQPDNCERALIEAKICIGVIDPCSCLKKEFKKAKKEKNIALEVEIEGLLEICLC